ncbi:MAG: hypothetical protein ACREAZ_02485 [Nitrososphaera sp.]
MNRRTIRYAKAGCIVAMSAIAVYAFARLYVFSQRADISILVINVVLFAAVAGFLIFLSKRERDLEEEELFRD